MGGGFFFLLTGGGVSCFLPDRKKRVGGFAGLQMWPVWWSPEGESSSGAEGVCRRRREEEGGGEFPAGSDGAEVAAPIVASNICL